MILCVTLNPCLDKTLTVPDWQAGADVRATAVREVVGGKGNNVARALRRLGHPARSATFLGGAVGRRCRDLFDAEADADSAPILVETAAPTREVVTVRAPGVAATAFFDPDPAVTLDEADALLRRVDAELARGDVAAMTLSGSSPARAIDGAYGDLIALAQARRIPTFLDTYGPPLAAIWGFWPASISLNRREIGQLLGQETPDERSIRRQMDRWARRGVRSVVVTDGPRDLLVHVDGQYSWVRPPVVDVVNPIGSGDSLVAGLVDAHLRGLDPHAALRRAVAAATANALVWDAGAIDPDAVGRLEAGVLIRPWTA